MHVFVHILSVAIFIGFSAIFSGLNIAMMSLSLPELKRQKEAGSRRARKVYPLRKNIHLTLTAILMGNVGAVSATALVLEKGVGNGLIAGVVSTLLLVVFGELLPQAFFAKRALFICALFAPFLKFVIFITYPIAKPLQILLDKLVGEHAEHQLHSRRELGMIITEHVGDNESELDEDEVEIIRGALQLSEKKTIDIMTDIRDVYWLEPDTLLDADKIDEIKAARWSRIPVFNKRLTQFYGSLHVKDLVDMDFDEESRVVNTLHLYPVEPVGSRTALDTLLRKFITSRRHLIPVEKNDKIIGIVTIEDVFEEIIGHEIIDESDHNLNRS